MKKTTISSLIGLLLSTSAYSATTMISADDVVVTASRIPQPRQSVIADVSVITREEIERAGQSTFVELLQKQPGVEISSNGGPGSLASVYLRGSNANQTIVLVDGVRINSITAGTTYFGNIPISQFAISSSALFKSLPTLALIRFCLLITSLGSPISDSLLGLILSNFPILNKSAFSIKFE